MLSWVVTFLVVALIAGILGFGGIAGASVEIAKAIFFIAVILYPGTVFRRRPRFCSADFGQIFPVSPPRNHRFRGRIVSSVDALARASQSSRRSQPNRGRVMLSWVVTFLVVALIAGILGFGGIAGASVEIAKAIFFIAMILFLVSAVVGLVRGRSNV